MDKQIVRGIAPDSSTTEQSTGRMYGQLIPIGGGDSIPLLKPKLTVGRRETCDIVLRFSNVSGKHCELTMDAGYWYITDLQSSNGVKVNGARVTERRLDPGALVAISKHNYKIDYDPTENGAVGPPPPDTMQKNIFGKTLLDSAGLGDSAARHVKADPQDLKKRFNVYDNSAGQIKDPNRPI